jgi:hypothetical protein
MTLISSQSNFQTLKLFFIEKKTILSERNDILIFVFAFKEVFSPMESDFRV